MPVPIPTPRRPAALVLGACVAVGLLTLVWLRASGPLPGELRAIDELRSLWGRSVALQEVVQFLADLGSPPIAGATVLVGAAILWRNVGPAAAAGLLAAALVVVVADLLKHLVGHTAAELQHGGGRAAPGFPSGHTAYATAVFGYLAVVGWRCRRPEVTLVLAGLIAAMGPAMVMRAAHLPSDVVAGYALGGAWLCLVYLMVDRVKGRVGTDPGRPPVRIRGDSRL